MNQKSVDILVVIAITIVAFAIVVLTPDGALVRLLTLPLVFVLPGYALTAAIFPIRLPGLPERLVFSLGLSLVVVMLGGLALNWTPFGLRTGSWLVLLSSIILSACAVTYIRRHRGQSIAVSQWSGIKAVRFTFFQGLLLSLAVIVVGTAIAISCIGAAQQPRPGFTQLWMVPAGKANPKNTVRFGVSNKESTVMTYRLVVNMDGKLVQTWPSLRLKPNENWETTLVLLQTGHNSPKKVEVMLYRTDAPSTVYRHVMLWLAM